MKIAWFSPLPPEHSEIANHTERLRPGLSEKFHARFFTESPAGFLEPAAGTAYAAPLGTVAPPLLPVLNQFDLPVYQLGNNPLFFSHTWFLSQRKPGIVVLHDLKLHHFFEGIFRERLRDQATYLRLLRRYYGRAGHDAGAAYWRQEISIDFMSEHFPMTEWAVDGALGVVVHTAHAQKWLRRSTDIPVVLAPLSYAAMPVDSRFPSQNPTLPPFSPTNRVRLIIFGFLNVNRRLIQFLAALAAMPERASFEVHILGTMLHRNEVEAALGSTGLRGQVTLHGYVTDEILAGWLDRAHLAVNLRYPTMGEASASQLRIWDHALPSLVTRTEGYADLPSDAVFFVRPDHEPADIQGHLRRFLSDPASFREAGRRGRQFLVGNHSPAAYVQRLAEFFTDADLLRSRHTQLRLAGRVGSAVASWLDAAPRLARENHYAAAIARAV